MSVIRWGTAVFGSPPRCHGANRTHPQAAASSEACASVGELGECGTISDVGTRAWRLGLHGTGDAKE